MIDGSLQDSDSDATAQAAAGMTGLLSISVDGGSVTGFIDAATPLTRQFLGIPFAKPPLGSLRFIAPQAMTSFGQLSAKKMPPSCMQYLVTPAPSTLGDLVPEFNLQGLKTTGAVSEDCLYLSVWTPVLATPLSKLPVLIFVYGGAFQSGGMDVPYQKPAQWVQRTQSHLVVTFNYRLGIFGWPDGTGIKDKNLGMLDQRAAVEWVKNNIAKFGGDPARIMLWGQSAGGISVARYAYAWPTNPIVSGFIMDSGTEYLFAAKPAVSDQNRTGFHAVAEMAGCGGLSAAGELTCMQARPAQTLEMLSLTTLWAPTVDNKIVFPNGASSLGAIAKIPAIIGFNSDEGSSPGGVDTGFGLVVECAVTNATNVRLGAKLDTFLYLYHGNFTNISPQPWMGAYHSSELPLLFGTHPDYRGPSSTLEYASSWAMQDAWLAFARGGAKGLRQDVGWNQYTADARVVRNFGDGVAVSDAVIADRTAFCKLIPPIQV